MTIKITWKGVLKFFGVLSLLAVIAFQQVQIASLYAGVQGAFQQQNAINVFIMTELGKLGVKAPKPAPKPEPKTDAQKKNEYLRQHQYGIPVQPV